jgi:hypothetical protein
LYLAERLPVVVEQRSGKNLASTRRTNTRGSGKPSHIFRERSHGGYGHHRGCFKHRPVLVNGLCLQLLPYIDDRLTRRQVRRLQCSGFLSNLLPFPSKCGDIERWRIDRCGQARRRTFQAIQHFVDARELRIVVQETLLPECIGDFGYQVAAHPGEIRKRREHPDR